MMVKATLQGQPTGIANKVFRLAADGSITLPEQPGEMPRRESRLRAIANMFQETDWSVAELNQLITEEILSVISEIKKCKRTSNSEFKLKACSAQVRALRDLQRSAMTGVIVDTTDPQHPEIQFVFTKMIPIFKQAAEKALGESTTVVNSILTHFQDEFVMAEPDIFRQLRSSRSPQTEAPRTTWRWSSIQKLPVSMHTTDIENGQPARTTAEVTRSATDALISAHKPLTNLLQAELGPEIAQKLKAGDLSLGQVKNLILRNMALVILEMREYETDPASAHKISSCNAEMVALRKLIFTSDRIDLDGSKFHFFVRRALDLFETSARDALGGQDEVVESIMQGCRDGLDAAGPKIRRELEDHRKPEAG
jgi:hypothetical protein